MIISHPGSDPARMRTLRTVTELRSALAPARREGRTVGLVPTMGALHEGHLSLLRAAREQCDVVVVSLFVNPSQFDEPSDLERYPRDEARDAQLAREAGADLLFAPGAAEVYPAGFATSVQVAGLSEPFEGEVRGAAHFRGVATVVTKLLCMALPDVAYFGRKDAQQLLVIRRLVEDLNLPVRIEAIATVREPDGLALSSRNALLTPEQRASALGLPAALERAQELAREGERSAPALLARGARGDGHVRAGARVRRARRPRHARAGAGAEQRGAAAGGRARRRRAPDRQHNPRAPARTFDPHGRSGDRARLGGVNPRPDRSPHVKPPHHPHPRRPGAPADDAAAAGGEEATRRTDRDGDRV